MPLINLTVQHGQTLDEARRRLELSVNQITAQFGSLIQRIEWAADQTRVKLTGAGFWVEMSVDAVALHATGDIPILGQILAGPMSSGLRRILERTFQKKLPL
jgi:putative polyhydroxyalkanoic acid system protein